MSDLIFSNESNLLINVFLKPYHCSWKSGKTTRGLGNGDKDVQDLKNPNTGKFDKNIIAEKAYAWFVETARDKPNELLDAIFDRTDYKMNFLAYMLIGKLIHCLERKLRPYATQIDFKGLSFSLLVDLGDHFGILNCGSSLAIPLEVTKEHALTTANNVVDYSRQSKNRQDFISPLKNHSIEWKFFTISKNAISGILMCNGDDIDQGKFAKQVIEPYYDEAVVTGKGPQLVARTIQATNPYKDQAVVVLQKNINQQEKRPASVIDQTGFNPSSSPAQPTIVA